MDWQDLLRQSSVLRAFIAWLLQLLASCAWVISVIIYASYGVGDILQLAAALCWTLSNAAAAPETLLPLLGRRERPVAVEVLTSATCEKV